MYYDDNAISVKNLNKCFRIYDRPEDRLKQGLFKKRKYYREFWALKDINFQVNKGETLGIIGRNGSGKSTLLQIIAGTLSSTAGDIFVNGKVAALLELGSGFNPEFTGRENIYLNGAILGLTREEVDKHFNEIIFFADIGDFIDQPVKTYSSGMVLRLAFAVQAIIPKEILIVDEALAVGDEMFQRKCFAKIEEFKKQGGTILFVSHDGGSVIQLCDRALLLDQGEQVIIGPSKQVVNLYQKLIFAPAEKRALIREELKEISSSLNKVTDVNDITEKTNNKAKDNQINQSIKLKPMFDPNLIPKETIRYESLGANIFDSEILTIEGDRVNILVPGKRYIWRYFVNFERNFTNVRFGMLIKTLSGLELGGAVSAALGKGIPVVIAESTVRVEFEFEARLAPGTYFLNAGVLSILNGEEVYIERCIDLGMFKVIHDSEAVMTALVDFGIIPQVYCIKEHQAKEKQLYTYAVSS